jgi:K+ transporter
MVKDINILTTVMKEIIPGFSEVKDVEEFLAEFRKHGYDEVIDEVSYSYDGQRTIKKHDLGISDYKSKMKNSFSITLKIDTNLQTLAEFSLEVTSNI